MLVHIKKIIQAAVKGKYAVGAFNVNNLEIIQAVCRAAEKMKSAAIIQTTEGAIRYAGLDELFALIKAAAEKVSVPIAIHLDHGHDFDLIKKCVEMGYSSVMIDGSARPFAANVRLTKNVVKFARPKGVWVQGELGRLEGAEDWIKTGKGEAFLTEPEEAVRFVRQTAVDTLAVAIGNYHGVEKIVEKKRLRLNLRQLEKISRLIKIPLVLHGASGFSANQIKAAIKLGIRVVNIDSELRVSFATAERKFLSENKKEYDPRKILGPAIAEMQEVVERKMKIFGSAGKA
ncbi:class II fructose-bisphosphate aldolase family protein [Candidatus Falkowbacteria bacterium]|nr:class II fructose-bisphosphate aldolase family protein [Candidatus Falkowbacteria bacterium]